MFIKEPQFKLSFTLKSGKTHKNRDFVSESMIKHIYELMTEGSGAIKVAPNDLTIIMFNISEISEIKAVQVR